MDLLDVGGINRWAAGGERVILSLVFTVVDQKAIAIGPLAGMDSNGGCRQDPMEE
jgi:hypothetical protein